MSEEKIDLSSFDGIADRVARAKAKAEAFRAAKAGGGTHATPAPPQPAPPDNAETPPAPQASAAEEQAEHKVDLSNLDAITDRVARAKAKAEAFRAAKAAGTAHPAPAAAPKAASPRPQREVSAEAMAAKKAQARAAQAETAPTPPTLSLPGGAEFCAGMTVRRNGKLARIVSMQHENICLVYEETPRERMMTKRYRLEVERQRGTLQFASSAEFAAAIPPSAGKFGRAVAFLAAAGVAGLFFLGTSLLIGPLGLFPTLLVGYILFALAYHLTK